MPLKKLLSGAYQIHARGKKPSVSAKTELSEGDRMTLFLRRKKKIVEEYGLNTPEAREEITALREKLGLD